MATVVVKNSGGNFATAGTWMNVCTGTNALFTTLTAAETESGTSYVYSQAFTVTNAENIEGVALHLRRAGVTGTLTVGLSADNGSTAAKEVTVNLSDLPSAYSWCFFKFDSVLAADGGSDYTVGIKMSSGSSGISIYRGSATANDWSHILREDTAAAALSAGDVFYVFDDLTGAGAKTANTVVMNEVAAAITDYGEVNVGQGTLNFGTTAATAYYLKLSGNLNVWGDGVLTIGTTGTKMPSDSSAVLEFDPTSDGEFGLLCKDGSTVTLQGNPMTKVWSLLNANAAANATELTSADSTGWASGDEICVGTTSRTYSECEKGDLNGAASGTTLTVHGFGGTGGGLAYAHSGSAGGPNGESTRAEIINLTRNVKIRSATSTLMAYIYCAATSTCDWDYAEFYYLGENTAGKRGIEVATTTGSFNMQYCSLHDCEDWGFYSVTASGSPTFSNNVTWNLNSAVAATTRGIFVTTTSGVPVLDGNVFVYGHAPSSGQDIRLEDIGLTFTNNRICGSDCGSTTGAALYIVETGAIFGTFSGNVIHASRGYGVHISSFGGGTVSTFTVWRCAAAGLYVASANTVTLLIITTLVAFGNTTRNAQFATGVIAAGSGWTLNGEASYETVSGLECNNTHGVSLFLFDSSLGASTAHSSRDLYFTSANNVRFYLFNTTLGSSAEALVSSSYGSAVYGHKVDGTGFRNTYLYGTVAADAATRHTASGYSWKLTPNSATYKLILPGPLTTDTLKAAVASGAAVTVTAWLYKDASYNGNAPRLVLVGDIVAGIDADVPDAMEAAAETWEQLSVTDTPTEAGVIEFYVDVDGTAGSVYVDDIAVTQ